MRSLRQNPLPCVLWTIAFGAALTPAALFAQLLGGDSPFPLPGGSTGGGRPTVTAVLTPADAQPGAEVTLSIRVALPEGSSTYSQDPSFQKPTIITVSESPGLETLDNAFTPDRPPERKFDSQFGKELEKYEGDVTWSRKYRLADDANPDAVYVRGQLKHLVCDTTCRPYTHDIAVSLTGGPIPPQRPDAAPEDAATPPANAAAAAPIVYSLDVRPESMLAGQPTPEPVQLAFRLEPQQAAQGDTVTLKIEMTIDEGWHSFSLERASDKQVGLPTLIKFDSLHNLQPTGEFNESPAPELYKGTDNAHFGRVTWTRQFTVTGDGGYGVRGSLRYSVCDKSICKRPKTVPYALGIIPATPTPATAGATGSPVATAGTATPVGPTGDVQPVGEVIEIAHFDLVEDAQSNSLAVNLIFAFLGGLILNVMPCVLPVIAIKVLSFVQQAGESRGRILALNLTYACGVVAVFLALAALAVFLGKGWGELFQNSQFNLVMAAFVFAMGLSLLGVFEIPVPGMVGSAAGGVHREGLIGAFATGIFATLLATPCSGPFMGTTLAWSLQQPALVVFLVWGVMGLGMASPYLVIGAFPQFVNWLPRPGMWMVRFKEFAGFVLMGAVIWLISTLQQGLLVPALVILVGVALGLWMIGNLYDTTSPIKHKWLVRASAVVLSAAVIGFGWNMQYRSTAVTWEEFSTQRIEELRKEGRPILIDFTADWCQICKANEALALDRPTTAEYFRKHGIVAIKADYTHESPEIARWLERSRQAGVPLTLIFPKGQPNRAIPLRGAYTQGQLLDVLRRSMSDGTAAPETAGTNPSGVPTTIAAPSSGAMAK